MFLRKFFNRLALSLITAALLFISMQVAISQDSDGTWKDAASGLLWTVKDGGSEMSWNQADAYCENLELAGQTDWRLPTLDELKTLYDRSLKKQYKAKEPIELESATVWSGTKNRVGDAWSLNFFNGGTSMSPTRGGCSSAGRALCVIGPAE
jgi:hypothetical protein